MVFKTGSISGESNQTMSIQLKNLNILMQAECDEMGPCMCPNTDLIRQQVQRS